MGQVRVRKVSPILNDLSHYIPLRCHDLQGCDGSVLLDDTVTLKGEKTASQNSNSLAGFDIIDQIKNKIESECPEIVSCADILTIAARDATILVFSSFSRIYDQERARCRTQKG